MVNNAVPIFEAKNKLPFYIHLAEDGSPVPISRHNTIVAYLVSKDVFENAAAPQKKNLVEAIAERRVEYGLEDDDFDISAYYESIKEHGYYGKSDSENLFEGV